MFENYKNVKSDIKINKLLIQILNNTINTLQFKFVKQAIILL